MQYTLNQWTRSTYYIVTNGSEMGGGFSTSTFISYLTYDIDKGWPFAGNIVEYANTDRHLVGHPRTAPIFHWIAIKGYANYGYSATYDDSGSGDTQIWSWAVNVPPVSTKSSSDMTTLLNQRGFVW
jgi:hypothetical protein